MDEFERRNLSEVDGKNGESSSIKISCGARGVGTRKEEVKVKKSEGIVSSRA